MWAYNFMWKNSRSQVPRLKSFLKVNHDLPKCWCEQTYLPTEDRSPFILRLLRFLVGLSVLLMCTILFLAPKDEYYEEECLRREECYNYCNSDYFPDLACVDDDYYNPKFTFNGNEYSEFFVYARPSDDAGNYEVCEGYLKNNDDYEFISHEGLTEDRQARLHTCFSYCRRGEDARFTGDERRECDDIPDPVDRDRLLCVYPDEECEFTTVPLELTLGGEGSGAVSISLLTSVYATLVAGPICFCFEILCILLGRTKVRNKHSFKQHCWLMVFQILVCAISIVIFSVTISWLIEAHQGGRPALLGD